jgi:hypothetical protein
MRRSFVVMIFLMAVSGADARAQLPVRFSLSGGLAIPVSNEKDIYENGLHVGAGLKLPVLPLQIEAGFDQMRASGTNEDLNILSGGLSLGIPVTPPLLPVGLYFIAGGGVYRTKAEATATDFGINGGAGVRVGVPGISLFGEGRGVVVLSEISKLSYVTVSVGIRF